MRDGEKSVKLCAMARISDLLAAGRTYSVEFFPPKQEAGWLSLGRTISELEHLAPDFVSVTYGAGGSTRTRTADVHLADGSPHLCRSHT
jgi:methylenetetrahydrofolate reductase (NADPH)